MNAWEKIGEEASIVLVGHFNPSIFHPEWFIRHQIVPAWNYQGRRGGRADEELAAVAVLPDLAQVEFPDKRNLSVMLNKFVLRSARASEFLTIKDMVAGAFEILQETPVTQMGMNYQTVVRIANDDLWHQFGESMTPREPWLKAAPYINDLDEDKKLQLGLVELTMQMPRLDDLQGNIRPTIKAVNFGSRELSFSVNNHVEIRDGRATTMIDCLNGHWESAMDFADEFILTALADQLGAQ